MRFTAEVLEDFRLKYSKEAAVPFYLSNEVLTNTNLLANFEKVRNKILNKYNDIYDFSEFEYSGTKNKSYMTCRKHDNKILIKPQGLLEEAWGCPICSKEKQAKTITKSQLDFINEASILHNNKYDYSESKYVGALKKVIIICPIHGKFNQTPNSHISSEQGCPKCGFYESGFSRKRYENKPTTFYCLELGNGLYKIGITSKNSIENRYTLKQDYGLIKSIVSYFTIFDGGVAWDIEKEILKKHGLNLYKGKRIFKRTGNTEILTVNPYEDIQNIIKDKLINAYTN